MLPSSVLCRHIQAHRSVLATKSQRDLGCVWLGVGVGVGGGLSVERFSFQSHFLSNCKFLGAPHMNIQAETRRAQSTRMTALVKNKFLLFPGVLLCALLPYDRSVTCTSMPCISPSSLQTGLEADNISPSLCTPSSIGHGLVEAASNNSRLIMSNKVQLW